MTRLTRLVLTWALAGAAAAGAVLAGRAQTPPPPPRPSGPVRDALPARGRGPGEPIPRVIPVGTSAIAGVVVSADTGRPISGARVMVNGTLQSSAGVPGPSGAAAGPMGVSRTATTDAQGQFVIERLPAGRFVIMVNRPSYLSVQYGQKRPSGRGTPLAVSDGQRARVTVQMVRGGVITGTVIGEDGDPLPNAQVRLLRYGSETGVRRLQQMNGAMTDDRGVYRLHGLQPGDYVVSAQPMNFDMSGMGDLGAIEQAIAAATVRPPSVPGAPATVQITVTPPQPSQMQGPGGMYLPTYFPGTSAAGEAATIHVNGGEERSGVDIPVRLLRASVIQGTVSAALAQGIALQVTLQPDDPSLPMNVMSNRAGPDGTFTFGGVAPDKYNLLAFTVAAPVQGRMGPPGAFPSGPMQLDDSQKLWARTVVNVEPQSVMNVNLSLQPGRSVSGHVIFETAQQPDLSQGRFTASLTPAPGMQVGPMNAASSPLGPDGRFTITGVMPGKYVLRASGQLKSSIVNGQDTLDVPLDFTGERDITDAVITVTDKSSEISGTLTDATGKPVFDYSILAASADPQFWIPQSRRILVTQPATDGAFTLRGLPPGDYLIAAVSDLEQGGQYDPEFLRSLAAAAVRVTVGEGAKLTQNLRVAK